MSDGLLKKFCGVGVYGTFRAVKVWQRWSSLLESERRWEKKGGFKSGTRDGTIGAMK